jgi:hypothetical protein
MGRLVLTRQEDLSSVDNVEKNNDIFSRLVTASDGSGKYTLEGDEVVRLRPMIIYFFVPYI